MHEIGFQKESRLTGTRTTDNKYIFVSGVLRVFGAVRHHKAFRLGEDNVVLKHGVHKGSNILSCAPSGRAVFQIFSKLLGVLAFEIHDKSDDNGGSYAHKQVNRVKARHNVFKCQRQPLHKVQRFGGKVRTRRKPCSLSELGGEKGDEHIRDIR